MEFGEQIEGEIYCHEHGCIHIISYDPYDTGQTECREQDWSVIILGTDYLRTT